MPSERRIIMTNYIAGIYCRLSKDDERQGESLSIGTQKAILKDFCERSGYEVYDYYIDDGFSGTNFERPGFQRLLSDIDDGAINMVITKDLSRLGRDYIMTGYYSEIYFPDHGIRYIALNDNFDSNNVENDIAPFKNILNDMYARDISRKIKAAKRQRAKEGLFISSQAPYGYKQKEDSKNQLVIDEGASDVVRMIFSLASQGHGTVSIAKELRLRQIPTPGAYKYLHGDTRFIKYLGNNPDSHFAWNSTTVRTILKNPVYVGDLISLKTESTNYKTKQRRQIPIDEQIIRHGTHEAIVSSEDFEKVQKLISYHQCPARLHRDNIFRGLLYCSECGHPLSIAHRKLKYIEDDCYRCTYHFTHPEKCKQTHIIYHQALSEYVLGEIHALAKAMRRRNVQSAITNYADIKELTPDILNSVISRIEIGHISSKSKLKNVVKIYWKLE